MTLTGRARAALGTGAALLLATALAGCSFGPPPPDQAGAPPRLPSPSPVPSSQGDAVQSTVDVLAKHLSIPWGIAFLPDGSGLVTERDTGRILKIGIEQAADGLKVTPVQTIPVTTGGDGGLLGIAVSPDYKTDKTVFIYYSTARDNRVASLKLGGKPTPIVTGIPHSGAYNGGALAFGPDGYLYAGTGEGGSPMLAQDHNSLAGKVLRFTRDGKPAPGNPYNNLVFGLGLHDPQGFAWDSLKRLYTSDYSDRALTEVNLVQPGKNYGWPAVQGAVHNPKYVDPIAQWRREDGGCAGTAIAEEMLMTACLDGTRLYALQLTKNGGVLGAPQPLLSGDFGRLRSIAKAPDGSLWVSTSNKDGKGEPGPDDDRILRIIPAGSAGSLS